jgi:putative redox protein
MPTITVQVAQLDHSASMGSVREHQLIMDRPEAKGGQNKGAMGGEALLMSLGGCFSSNLLAAAIARDIKLSNTHIQIQGELADKKSVFTDIHMQVSAECSEPDEFPKLVTISERGCIVANTLRNAVNLTIECA